MSKHYAAPEEILYHVGFSAEQLQGATVAVLPGDPGRVVMQALLPAIANTPAG
mgnify:CR=1 FL=1